MDFNPKYSRRRRRKQESSIPGGCAGIGPRTPEQMEDNLGSAEVEITDEHRERIDRIAPPGSVVVPYYDADFGPETYR